MLNFFDAIWLIIHNHGRNIRDFIFFVAALIVGEWFQPFAHWLAQGHLPPWIEQLAKVTPGAVVAYLHWRSRNRNKKDSR